MKYKRRVILTFCILTISFCLSGCWLKNITEQNDKNVKTAALTQSANLAMSASTHKELVRATDASDKAKRLADEYYEAKTNGGWPWHPFKRKKMEQAEAYADKTYSDFDSARLADTTYQESAKEAGVDGGDDKSWVPVVIIIIVVVVIAIIIVIIVLITRPKRVQENNIETSTPEPVEPIEAKQTGQLEVNYEKLLKSNCDKVGLNYDEVLADYGGDARRAYESTNLMIGKGETKEQMLLEMKEG